MDPQLIFNAVICISVWAGERRAGEEQGRGRGLWVPARGSRVRDCFLFFFFFLPSSAITLSPSEVAEVCREFCSKSPPAATPWPRQPTPVPAPLLTNALQKVQSTGISSSQFAVPSLLPVGVTLSNNSPAQSELSPPRLSHSPAFPFSTQLIPSFVLFPFRFDFGLSSILPVWHCLIL